MHTKMSVMGHSRHRISHGGSAIHMCEEGGVISCN
jgi:hypothetical protein